MKNLVVGASLAGALLASTAAHAALQIAFQNGASTLFCRDGQVCDLAGPTSDLLVLNQQVGAFHIQGSFASSGPDTLSDSNLTITNTSGTTQTLTFAVGDTGFLAPVNSIGEAGSGTILNSVGTSGSLSFHADTANTQGADTATDTPGPLLFNPSATFTSNPFAFNGNHTDPFSALSPFSMTLDYTFTIAPGGSIVGLESSMTALSAIPEPKTWVMLFAGFGLMAGLGWVKARKSPRCLEA
jgi:hypothetical protein